MTDFGNKEWLEIDSLLLQNEIQEIRLLIQMSFKVDVQGYEALKFNNLQFTDLYVKKKYFTKLMDYPLTIF